MKYKYKCGDKVLVFDKLKVFKQDKELSVILPTYNEEGCISRIIKDLRNVLKDKDYEIVIVDDDSKDATRSIIDSYKEGDVVALHRYGKKGIFSAIKDGVLIARGKIIAIMDADYSHPPRKMFEMLNYIDNYDIVSCSRFTHGAAIEAPFIQKYSTILLNRMLRLVLFDLGVTDFTGGFHAIRKSKFLDLNLKYEAVWGEFDIELFYRAKKKGFKIKEIPFIYRYREEGKSKSDNYLKYLYYYWKMALRVRLFG